MYLFETKFRFPLIIYLVDALISKNNVGSVAKESSQERREEREEEDDGRVESVGKSENITRKNRRKQSVCGGSEVLD